MSYILNAMYIVRSKSMVLVYLLFVYLFCLFVCLSVEDSYLSETSQAGSLTRL